MSKNRKSLAALRTKIQRCLQLGPDRLCLVSGPPRSGTTAMISWLGSRRDVASFFESRVLIAVHRFVEEGRRFRALSREDGRLNELARELVNFHHRSGRLLIGKKLILEKEPLEPTAFPDQRYEEFIESLTRTIPELMLLFIVRDPIETVWSMSQRDWGHSLTYGERQRLSIEDHAVNWVRAVQAILRFADYPNTYICDFNRLIADPRGESSRVISFLKLPEGSVFQPAPTKHIGLNSKERNDVLRLVKRPLDELRERGYMRE